MDAEMVKEFAQFAPGFFTNRNFNTALLKLFRHTKYDHKKMIQKLSYNSGALRHQAKEKFFLENLCEIYNYRNKDEEKIFPHELNRR